MCPPSICLTAGGGCGRQVGAPAASQGAGRGAVCGGGLRRARRRGRVPVPALRRGRKGPVCHPQGRQQRAQGGNCWQGGGQGAGRCAARQRGEHGVRARRERRRRRAAAAPVGRRAAVALKASTGAHPFLSALQTQRPEKFKIYNTCQNGTEQERNAARKQAQSRVRLVCRPRPSKAQAAVYKRSMI